MPTSRTPPPDAEAISRRGRHTGVGPVGLALLAVGLAAAVVALPGTASWAAAAGPRPTDPNPTSSGTTGPAAGVTVQGVLERLSVEKEVTGSTGSTGSTRAASITTWVRTGSRHVQVPAASMAGVATGVTVSVRLGSVQLLAGATTPRVQALATGPQTVTILMALLPGAKADGTSLSSLTHTITGGVSRFWSQASGGQISFAVSGSMSWTHLTGSCADVWGLWDQARILSHFVPGPRRHLVVYAPPTAGCPTGLSTVGDGVSAGGYTFVDATTTSLLAHELGHNLGLGHSNALKCTAASDGIFTAGSFGGRCQNIEYGDWYDVMGISWGNLGSLNTAQAYRLGVLGTGTVRTVSEPAVVVLQAVSGHTGLRSLRIQDPAGASYVVEYRPAIGADAWLATTANWRGLEPGVLIRRIDPSDPTQTLLLDPTPSVGAQAKDDWDVAIASGQSLTTASGRVVVTVEGTTATTAVITVSVDRVQPQLPAEPGGKLVDGRQLTIGEAPVTWAAAGTRGR